MNLIVVRPLGGFWWANLNSIGLDGVGTTELGGCVVDMAVVGVVAGTVEEAVCSGVVVTGCRLLLQPVIGHAQTTSTNTTTKNTLFILPPVYSLEVQVSMVKKIITSCSFTLDYMVKFRLSIS